MSLINVFFSQMSSTLRSPFKASSFKSSFLNQAFPFHQHVFPEIRWCSSLLKGSFLNQDFLLWAKSSAFIDPFLSIKAFFFPQKPSVSIKAFLLISMFFEYFFLQITVSVWINATSSSSSSSFLKVFLLINVFFLSLVYSHSPWGTPGVLGIGNRHWLQIGAPVSRRARQKFVFGKVSAGGNSSSVGNSSAGKVSPCNINSSLKWYSAAQAKRATLNADIMQLSPELMPRLYCCVAPRKKH